MTNDEFLLKFGHFIDAPNGIQKLRELILKMAVQGRLVQQDPSDESASDLLTKMADVKQKLIKDKKIRNRPSLQEVDNEEELYELPLGWEWVRLGDLGDWGAGATPNRKDSSFYDGKIPWFKSGELTGGHISTSEEYVTEKALKECSLRLNAPGDVLIAMYGATIGKVAILNVSATTNQAVCACTPYKGLYNEFLLMLLKAYKHIFTGQGAGGAQPNISRIKIVSTVAALPPTAEQHRIVAKVGELMALCEKLETERDAREATHQRLIRAVHHPLTEAGDASPTSGIDSLAAWHRIRDNFADLYNTLESVQALRQTILQLAVQGTLVEQNSNEESASQLLRKVNIAKKHLIDERIIRKPKATAPVTIEEKYCNLPSGWIWERLENISIVITDGTHQTPKYTSTGRPFISAQNIKPFKFMPTPHKFVSEEDYQGYIKNRKPEVGDVLLTRVGAGIGEAAVNDSDMEFAIYVSVGLIKIFQEYLDSRFIVAWLNSPIGREHSSVNTYGKGISQGNLNLSLIRNFVIAVPPLPEQKRIVAKVDELMVLCDKLEESIRSRNNTASQYTEAVVLRLVAA